MITIVIPAYQEQDRLPPTLREIEKFHNYFPDTIRKVIVVDDGSRDATVERALYYQNRIPLEVIRLGKNKGKWAAINRGLIEAKGLILLMDADGSASIWNLAKKGQVVGVPAIRHAVFGSRFMKSSTVSGKSFIRTVVSQGYRLYVKFWYLIGRKSDLNYIDDLQCPWKLFWKQDVDLPLETERFSGDLELACRLNAFVLNFPVEFHHVRGSKVPLQAVWKMLIETPMIALRMRKEVWDQKKF